MKKSSHDDSDEISLTSLNLTNLPSILEKIIMGGIIFILALPLLGDYGNLLFPIGRDVIFKITVEFLLFLVLVSWSFKNWRGVVWLRQISRSERNFRHPITLSILVFWILMLLSTINSVQMDFSIWGNIYKNQGLMTWSHYLLFFFLLISFVRNKNYWDFLIKTAIFVGVLVSLVAFWQLLQNGIGYRAAATLNNSNYLAAYLVLLVPITFSFFLRKPSYFLGAAILIQFLALLSTQTRGAYMGIAAAIFTFAFLYLLIKKSRAYAPKFLIFNFQFSKQFLLFLISAVIIILYSFVLLTPMGQSVQQKLPDFTDRFLNIESLAGGGAPRLEAWQAGWHGMLNKPLLGYGPENFFVAFDEFYSGSQDHTGSLAKNGSLWESWFDKAHNFIFDIGATTGFPGLFAYISIFLSAIFVLFKSFRIMNRESPPKADPPLAERIMAIGLVSAFVGYLVQNLFGFDTLVPAMYLIFFLAFTHFITYTNNQDSKIFNFQFFSLREIWHSQTIFKKISTSDDQNSKRKFKTLSFRISAICIILATISLFIISLKIHIDILRANYQLNLAESLASEGKIEGAFTAFEKGLEYNSPPINPNLRRRYAVISLAFNDAVRDRCPSMFDTAPREGNIAAGPPLNIFETDVCEKFFKDSRETLQRALVLQQENAATEWPRFTRNYIYAAQISHILGDYAKSDIFFGKALELSPRRASIYVEWSRLLQERGENDKASEKLQKAQEINTAIR